jgi:hypothetical protein
MEQFSSVLLTPPQEANHMHIRNRDFFQIQGDVRTATSHLVRDLAEMLRLRAPDQADGGSFSIRTPFEF